MLAIDIDGTLLNPQFQISPADLESLRKANAAGVEILLVTGRRHAFARPIAEQLGFDLWLISSNGAITRSLRGETFHRDMLPLATCRKLCEAMRKFRGQTVLTFDIETRGAIVLEHMSQLEGSIRKWLEKNMEFIELVVPIENALVTDPVQAMFCGPLEQMKIALAALQECGLKSEIHILRTEYPLRNLAIVDVLKQGCSKGHALERWAVYRNVAREQVMAIGDNHNDIEMLAFAGVPFIMGNAVPELRQAGWQITSPNDQNGVANAIRQVLGPLA